MQFGAFERCWSIVLKRQIVVSNTRPAVVHVYDYYETGFALVVHWPLEQSWAVIVTNYSCH